MFGRCHCILQEPTRTCGTGAGRNPGSTRQTRTRACRRTRIAVSMPAKSPRRPPSSSCSAPCRGRRSALKKTPACHPCRSRRPPRPSPTQRTNAAAGPLIDRLPPCTIPPPCLRVLEPIYCRILTISLFICFIFTIFFFCFVLFYCINAACINIIITRIAANIPPLYYIP